MEVTTKPSGDSPTNSFTPHKYQQEMIYSDARFILASAGVRSGKTTGGALALLHDIVEHPKDNFLIAAPTYKILEQSTLPKFFEFFPMAAGIYRKQPNIIKLLPNGGNIYCRSVENPDSIEGMDVRSAWLDEAGMMKPRVWTNAMARVSMSQGKIYMTTTPYSNGGWLQDEIERPAQAGDRRFLTLRWRSIDNPGFPLEEYELAKKRLPEDEFQRRYHGEFRKMSGLVYPEWNPKEMIVNELPEKFSEIIAGLDFGYSHPTVMEVIGITPDNKVYVLQELYQTKMQPNELIKEIKEIEKTWNIEVIYADSASPAPIDALNQNMLTTLGVEKGDGSVKSGILKVRQLMKNKHFFVYEGCRNLIDELELYHYKLQSYGEDRRPQFHESPEKDLDDSVDALRYAIYMHQIQGVYSEFEIKKGIQLTDIAKVIDERINNSKMRIARYGQDYADEDIAILDSTGFYD